MKPLSEVNSRFGLKSHHCANGSQLYFSVPLNPSEAVGNLSYFLGLVMGWETVNKLRPYPEKLGRDSVIQP